MRRGARRRRETRRLQLRQLQIVAESLEHRFPQQAVVSERAVFHLDLEVRFNPGRLRLPDGYVERRGAADQRIEALAQFPRALFGVAAADLAGIEQLAALAPADIERGDLARVSAELFDKGYDRQRIALLALQLDPALLPAGAVRRVDALGHDAFQPEPTGRGEHLIAPRLDALDEH